MEKQPKKTGRPQGATNMSTRKAREAIAQFVDSTAPHMREWLSAVAYGIPKTDSGGKVIRDNSDAVEWVNRPDPLGAIKAVEAIMDYHLPRLSRQEVSATVEHLPISEQSSAVLQRRVLESLGIMIDAEPVEPVDVEPLPVSDQQPDVG